MSRPLDPSTPDTPDPDPPHPGVPQREAEPNDDAVVLYNPEPKDPLPIDDYARHARAGRRWRWVLAAVFLLVGAVGAYAAVGNLLPREDAQQAVLPTMKLTRSADEGLRPIAGVEVSGTVGSAVEIGIRAVGAAGIPLADTLVRFTAASGPATVLSTEVRTGADGVARTAVQLPTSPETTIVVADLEGSTVPSTRIAATALPGLPVGIRRIGGDAQNGQIGELLPERVAVTIVDEYGNPVPSARVVFGVRSGSGMVAPQATLTDSYGQADALWRLGFTMGEQHVAAILANVGSEVVFTATAVGREGPLLTENQPPGVETAPVTVRRSGFAIGGSHVCRLADAGLSCRGANDRGQASAEATTEFVALAAGLAFTCGLDVLGFASCWGANDEGQLGDGGRNDRASALRVRTELRFSSLSAGAGHACGLAGGGAALCWGRNLNGQLGDGSRNNARGPRTVGTDFVFRSVVAGWNHTCGLSTSGNAWCWGSNENGQLGDGSRLDRLLPVLALGSAEHLVAGSSHTCGISGLQVMCWGHNAFGQLGDGTQSDRLQPNPVRGLPGPARMLATGAAHTCALVTDGTAYCWGQNLYGQIGDGTTYNRPNPVRVGEAELRFAEIHAGGALTCALTQRGEEYCWGMNRNGQLGDGSRASRSTPTRVGG